MIPERLPVVVVALCCIYAAGICATTLQSSVTTDPNDAVDVNTDVLPFPDDAVGKLKHRVATAGDAGDPGAVDVPTPSDGPAESAGEPPENSPPADGGGGGSGADADQAAGSTTDPDRQGSTPVPRGLLDRLLDALRRLLAVWPWALLLAGLLVAAAVAARYREAIREFLGSVLAGGAGREGQSAVPTPSNEVARTWYEMVSRLDAGLDRSKTPAEYADLAVAAGVDPETVATITRTFEEVRYGGKPVTEQRAARAARARDRLLAQLDRGGSG